MGHAATRHAASLHYVEGLRVRSEAITPALWAIPGQFIGHFVADSSPPPLSFILAFPAVGPPPRPQC